MALELPALPYAYDALGPYMSKETLEYHHDKHHMAYVTNGNAALKDSPLADKSIEEICKVAFADKIAPLVNNVGQHYNHLHFWNWMKPNGGGKKIPAKLQAAAAYAEQASLATDLAVLARTVRAPADLPLGAVTALVGVPFFLLRLRRLAA
jgi:superoxide dismutase